MGKECRIGGLGRRVLDLSGGAAALGRVRRSAGDAPPRNERGRRDAELVRPHLSRVTVAPITTTIRGLSTEVPVGPANGLDRAGVVSCDDVVTIPTGALGRQVGHLLEDQELDLTAAIRAAFDLD